ncbi:MAG TPA: EF-hand domain-containing protein [Rhizomicrobium sp.]
MVVLTACAGTPRVSHWSSYTTAPRAVNLISAKATLASFDSDGDGKVTRRELEAGLRQRFWQADANRDNRLDPDEVAAANQRMIDLSHSDAIPLIDWNHDGTVDFDEFASGLRSLFDDLDANGDDQVTADEFRHAPD